MVSSGLLVTICEEVKKPVFSEIQVIGLGPFSELTDKIATDICFNFAIKGYVSSMIRYGAMTSPDGKILYNDEESKERSRMHEEFHVLIKKAKLRSREFKYPAKAYWRMFEESAANAVGEYCLMQEMGETISASTGFKRQLGREVYSFVGKAMTLESMTKKEIKNFAEQSKMHHATKNWSSILVEATYFGMIDPCYAIMQKNGLKSGQQELISLAISLKDDPTAKTFFKELRSKSGIKIKKNPPIKGDMAIRGIFEYGKDEDYLRIVYEGQKKQGDSDKGKMLSDVNKKISEKYARELTKLGERWKDFWAPEIILGGYE